MKIAVLSLFALSVILAVAFAKVSYLKTRSQRRPFQFNKNGTFTILQVTDLHLADGDDKDADTMKTVQRLIEATKPDLVMVTGDVVTGYVWDRKSPDFFLKYYKQFAEVFNTAQQYYALVLGNHDIEADLTNQQIFDLEEANPWSVSERGPLGISGASNYLIQVQSRLNTSCGFHPALNLWVFDSHQEGCLGESNSFGCVAPDQVDWYEALSKEVEAKYGKGKGIEHTAFVHIPLPEFMNVWNDEPTSGDKQEGVACPAINTGLFDRMIKRGDISAIFVGHDHINDYEGVFRGVDLFYGWKTGNGTYGDPKGGRLIKYFEELDAEGEPVIRKEHFTVDLQGNLNANLPKEKKDYFKQTQCNRPREEKVVDYAEPTEAAKTL